MNSTYHHAKRWVVSAFGGLTALLLAAPLSAQLVKTGGAITINDKPAAQLAGKATPYPAEVEVKDTEIATIDDNDGAKKTSKVARVVLRLSKVTHAYPDDIDMVLSSPRGDNVLVMSDAGGRFSLNGVDLTIDDVLKDGNRLFLALPDETAITSGTWSSANYELATDIFPDGPAAPFLGSLAAFNGKAPDGKWKLYVVDDQTVDGGEIAQWALDIYLNPLISLKIGENFATVLKFNEDSSGTVQVNLKDSDTPANQLVVTASSSNKDLVDTAGLVVTGSGESRTLTVTPKPNANGTATITVKVSDGVGEDTDTFTLTVDPVNDPATIAFSATQVTTAQGVLSAPITVTVEDVDNNVETDLTLKALLSSTPGVAGVDNVFFGPIQAVVVDGNKNIRKGTAKVYFAPNGAATGTTTFSIGVTDLPAVDPVNKGNVDLVVNPVAHKVFANVAPITGSPTAPYPSELDVTGVPGMVGKITVVLANLNMAVPENLDVVLESPAGTKVTILGQAGGDIPVSMARITLDDAANDGKTPPVPVNLPDGGPLTTGTYVPNDFDTANEILNVGKPTDTKLVKFQGENPNGKWKLYVHDKATPDAVELKNGFVLNIYPSPKIDAIVKQTMDEEAEITVAVSVSDLDGTIKDKGVTAVSENPALVTAVAEQSGGTWRVRLKGQLDQHGTTFVAVTAEDNDGYKTTIRFEVEVRPVNDAPVLAAIPKQVTTVGQKVPPFEISFTDVDSLAGDFAIMPVAAQSNNPKLLPNANIFIEPVAGSPNRRLVTMYPAGTQGGVAEVTITVSDRGTPVMSDSKTFTVTVDERQNPLFDNPTALTIRDATTAGPGITDPGYPSELDVAGLVGEVVEVQVILSGLSHPNPDDLDIMLVGPSNAKVMLMSDAGGSTPVVNAQLKFRSDIAAISAIPDNGPIVSGDYRPGNYDGGDPDTFPTAPSGTVGDSLETFKGLAANGKWKLFIVDDKTENRGGTLAGGWVLSIRTKPVISSPGPQTVLEDTLLRVPFSIGDAQTRVVLSATSSDATLIPNGNLKFVPSGGAAYVLEITPGENQPMPVPPVGTTRKSTITIAATGFDGASRVETSFEVSVLPVDDPPKIDDLAASYTTRAGMPSAPIAFKVSDVELADFTKIKVDAVSNDQSKVPDRNIVITKGTNPGDRVIVITPVGIETGTVRITVTANDKEDGTGMKTSKDFDLVIDRTPAFANTTPIVIVDNGTARPDYPSEIQVAGVAGLVSGVSVTLDGLAHPYPDDIDVVLVYGDKKVMLLSDAGGGQSISPAAALRLTFKDGAATMLPDNGPLTSGEWKPSDYEPEVSMPGGAPNGPYGNSLSAFKSMNPNGAWKLYIADDTFPDGGEIQRGWILNLETGPRLETIANTSTDEDVAKNVEIVFGDADTTADKFLTANFAVTLFKLDNNPATADLIKEVKIEDGTGFTRTLKITPKENMSGKVDVEVKVTDDKGNSDQKRFTLTINPVDDPPVIAVQPSAILPDAEKPLVTVDEDALNQEIKYKVKDVDSKLELKNVTATSSNTALVPNGKPSEAGKPGIEVIGPAEWTAGTDQEITVRFTPNPNAFGTADIALTVKDATSTVTKTVPLKVNAVNDLPTIAVTTKDVPSVDPAKPASPAGSVIGPMAVTINDIETEAKLLEVTATSNNQALVPNVNLVWGGSGSARTLTVTTIGTVAATATITVTVKDGENATATTTFVVTVVAATQDTIANTTPITIRDNTSATPYPSEISFTGRRGKVHAVEVTLDGLTHNGPDDVDILLVSPDNRKVMIMSDAGGRNPVQNLRLTFKDGAPALPDDAPLASGTFAPSNYDPGTGDLMSTPAPAGPYADTLAAFKGGEVNGSWKLFVMDDFGGDAGQIFYGWSLKVVTAPEIRLVSPGGPGPYSITSNEDVAAEVTFEVFSEVGTLDKVVNSYRSSNPTLIPEIPTLLDEGIRFDGVAATRRATMKPAANLSGENKATITVTRTTDGASASFEITHTVLPVNDLPAISRITSPQTTEENRSKTIDIRVTDPDTEIGKIGLKVTVLTGTDIIDNAGVSLNDTGRNEITLSSPDVRLVLTPKPFKVGTASIQVEAIDGGVTPAGSSKVTFNLVVTAVDDPPTIALSTPAIVNESGQTSDFIAFTVGDPDTTTLKITVDSSDEAIIKKSNIQVYLGDKTTSGLEGPPGERFLRVTSEQGIEGERSVDVGIKVTDSVNPAVGASLQVNVRPTRERAFSYTREIVINPSGKATEYPAALEVTGLVGKVETVKISLNNFTHNFPDDVDVLLVSPGGEKVSIIMSDAGGNVPITVPVTLRFDNAAAGPIPDGSIGSSPWTYKPANYEGNSTDSWPDAPQPPAGGFTADLTNFKGATASGTWSLYITDDTPGDGGLIKNGFTLNIKTAPYIQGLADETTDEDVPISQSFTIVEEDFASDDFTITGSSSKPDLVPNANITFAGEGANRVVHVLPAQDQFGSADITVTVKNKDGQEVKSTFKLTVTPVNDPPFISQIPTPQVVRAGEASALLVFTYGDVETDKKNLPLTVVSDNDQLLPASNIYIVGNTLQFAPVGAYTGTANITISTVDEGGLKASMTFTVVVRTSSSSMFANTGALTIPVSGKADPYPSVLEAAGISGLISKVKVTLVGVNHTYPDDLDILVVSPTGEKVLIMSDAGGSADLVNTRLVFDDAAAAGLPDNSLIASGTYKPTNHDASVNDSFPDVPAGPISNALSAFNGKEPNGLWKLFVMDDGAPDSGSIAGGWIVEIITTTPTISLVEDQTLLEDTPMEVLFTVEDGDTPIADLSVSGESSDPRVVTVHILGTGKERIARLIPAPDASGQATIVLSVRDDRDTASTSFLATVLPVNDAPTITGLADVETPANATKRMTFYVTDPDTEVSAIRVEASLDKPDMGRLSVEGEGSERVLVFAPLGLEGETTITVTATDGEDSSEVVFLMTVTPRVGPTIGFIEPQSTPEDTILAVPFTVTSADPDSLEITASAADPLLVASVVITGEGDALSLAIALVADAFGTSEISISATDSFGATSTGFTLTVLPVNDAPVLGPIADQKTGVDAALVLPLAVTDVDNALTDLVFSGVAADLTLVNTITFAVIGEQVTATVTPVSGAKGETTVTISVSDGTASVSQAFKLTVEEPRLEFTSITLLPGDPPRIRIEWTGGGVLQIAESVNGPWIDQPGATSPVEVFVDLTRSEVFARLKN